MIDLSNTPVISSVQTSSHEEAKIIAFHAVRKSNDENIMDKLATSINSTQNNIVGLLDWSGIPLNTYIVIGDEILFLSQISGSNLTVNRGLFGTVATSHNAGEYIYTIDIFQNVGGYSFTEKLGVNDRDLFSVDCGDGTINIYDEPYKWNMLSSESVYKCRRNKEVFIFEGCNKQLIKTYEGIVYQKIGSSRYSKITFQIKNSIWKFLDENIPIIKMYDNIKPKELFEDMFSGYTAKYVNDTNESTYFKINNISTGEFATYRDFLNFVCKEYGINIIFRKDKTIHITSLINQSNITPSVSILTEVTDINDDEANNTIINKVTGSYLERKTLYDENDFTLGGKLQYINFKASKSFTNTTINIISGSEFKEITLTGFTDDDIQTMNYKDYMLLRKSDTEQYMCKLTDIIRTSTSPNIYSIKVLCGYDKASYWNERGRITIETGGTGSLSWTSANFTLHWVFLELPIVWKYGRKINNEDKYSNIMYPLKPSCEEVIYLEKFGVGDNSNSKFSGLVKGLDGIVNATYMDNTKIYYNKEFAQNNTETPIYLYTNNIDGTKTDNLGIISIGSIDNSNIQVKFENSDIKNNIYKITLKNTKTQSTTYNITPTTVFNGQTLIAISASDYALCNIGDMLELKEVDSSNPAYSTYLSWKGERWLIDSKFIDSGIYYITVNTPYPLAYGGINFTFTKYNRNDIILLNEFYLRANPIMETSNSYDYKNQPSIDEYGTKEITLEGKATSQADFLKILSYFKDCFHATTTSSVHNRIRFNLTKRLDLEVGDCIYLSDLLYTKYNNQKVLITQKKVSCDSKGLRTEEYEGMTFGNYTINPTALNIQSSLSYNPITVPKYNHRGTEGSDTASNDSQVDNKRITLQDDVEGQIFVEQIDSSFFTAKVSTSTTILSTDKTFNIDINNISGIKSSAYTTSLLSLNSEGIIKINNEYLTYKTIAGVSGGVATIQIIKRGIANTDVQDIYNGIRVQFYKILAKQSAEGFKTTAINAGDNVNNYAVVNEDVGVQIKGNGNGSGNSYINLNNGTFQAGRVSNINGKADFNGMYLGDTTIANNKHIYYDGTTVKISANVEIGNSTASTVVSNASNGQLAYNGTNIIRDTTSAPTNNAIFGSITFNSTSDGNIVANISYTYTQGAINADSLVFYYKQGGGTVTSSDVAYIKNAVSGNINFILIPNTVYSFGIQAVRKSNNAIIGGSIVQSGNYTTPAGNYTNKINSSDTSNYLYVGSNVRIGKDAYATGKDGVSITTNGYLNVANNNNALYFDPTVNGDLSYLRMNNGSQQIGKVTGLTKIVPQSDFNGFFIGDKDLTNKNYLMYNGFGIDLKSKVVGSVAYVNSDSEFNNAINGTGKYAPFEYNEICLTSSFNLTKSYLISTLIKKINLNSYAINGVGLYGISAAHSLNIINGQLNCNIQSTLSTNKLYLENIYSSAGSFAGCILKNIEINKTSDDFTVLFSNCINSTGIKINISSSVVGTLFDSCNNISNIEIDIPTYSSSLYIFNLCMSVSNFKMRINGGKVSGAGILGNINGYNYCNSMVVNGYIDYYATNGSLSLPELNYIYSMSNVTGNFSSPTFQENMFFIDYDSCDIDKPQMFKETNIIAINEPTTTTYKEFYIPKKSQILNINFTNTSQGYVVESTELDIDSSITGYTYVLNIINDAGTWRMYKVYSSGNMATQVTTYFTVNPNNISFFIKTDVTTRFMNIVSLGG